MKIAAVQLNYIVADFDYNFTQISQAMKTHQEADLIVFSELCIIGYYPYDLLTYAEIIEKQHEIVERIKALSAEL